MTDGTSTILSANIKRLREEAGLSQKALADQSGVPRPTIAHLESGQANPTLTVALKVAAALGVGVDELVQRADSPVVILGPRELSTQKTSRIRRVQLNTALALRDPRLERVTVKAASRLSIEASTQSPALICVERGDFSLVVGEHEYPLPLEAVAQVRAPCHCQTTHGGSSTSRSGAERATSIKVDTRLAAG